MRAAMRRGSLARRWRALLLATALIALGRLPAFAHGETLLVGTATAGGTNLTATFTPPLVAAVTASFSAGGLTLSTGQFPSFEWATTTTTPPPYPLPTGTQVRMQIVAIEAGASVKIAAATIDAPGESALVGNVTPGEHVHPEWQLTLPTGVVASRVVQFVFTAAGFVTSPVYAVTVTNAADTPTPSATVTATASPTEAVAVPTATDTPTPTDTATPSPTTTPAATAFACAATPVPGPCRGAAHAGLLIADGATPARRRLMANWTRADAADTAALGDPTSDTSYALCVYDHHAGVATLTWSAVVPPGGQCGPRPCWQRSRSGRLRYRDRDLARDGVASIGLRPGSAGRSAVSVKVIPPVLPPLPLAQDPAVLVQLRNSLGACWEASFAAPAQASDSGRFTDSID